MAVRVFRINSEEIITRLTRESIIVLTIRAASLPSNQPSFRLKWLFYYGLISKSWAENIARHKNIIAVILFGSLAKNGATPASDADILILLKDSKERFDNRIPNFIPEKIGLGVDVFPYTLEEFHSSLKNNWGIAREAITEGILLYKNRDIEIEPFT